MRPHSGFPLREGETTQAIPFVFSALQIIGDFGEVASRLGSFDDLMCDLTFDSLFT
jgi:hypothetical protein